MRATIDPRRGPAGGAGRKGRAVLLALALTVLPVMSMAPAAHADSASDTYQTAKDSKDASDAKRAAENKGTYDDLTGATGQECRPNTLGNAAGSGFPGIVDPAPKPITPADTSPAAAEAARKLQDGANNRIYHVFGWSGYNWEVCATGGPVKGLEMLGMPKAWTDSENGSTMLKMATGIAALNTGTAKMAATPGAVMKPLDDIVVNVSTMLKNSLVDLWFPIVLMAAAALIAINAMTKNLRKALTSVGAILASIAGVAYLSFAPLEAARIMDGVASSGQAAVLQKALEFTGKKDVPADETWGVIYTEDIIFPYWAEGITGWKTDDARLKPHLDTERLDPAIKPTQKFDKFTPTQAYQIRAYPWDTAQTTETDNDRRDAWNTIGEASQTPDAPTRAFAGQELNRTGFGGFALASVVSVAAFNIPANLMIFVAEVAFRLLPIVGFLLLLMLAFEPLRPLAYQMGRFFLACMVNGIIVGVFAAAHLAIVAALFTSTIGMLWATVITAIVSALFFMLTKPVRSLTNTVVSVGKGIAGGVRSVRPGNSSSPNQGPSRTANQRGPNQPNTDGQGATTNTEQKPSRLKRQLSIDPPKRRKAPETLINTTNPKAGLGPALRNIPTPPIITPNKTTSNAPVKPAGKTPANAPGTTGGHRSYRPLGEARKLATSTAQRVRRFVPPNTTNTPSGPSRAATQKGDRPTQRKFIPTATRPTERDHSQPVAPLKSRS